METKKPLADATSDPVIDAYKSGIDVTLIRDNLRLTPTERLQRLQDLQAFAEELQKAGRELRRRKS